MWELTLKKEIERTEDYIKRHKEEIKNQECKLLWFKSAKEIKTSELYAVLESLEENIEKPIDGFVFEFKKGEYTYILGGDDRSAPWDEKRNGLICTIDSDFWFSEEQIRIIKKFLEEKRKVNDLNFINQNRGFY